MFKLKALHFDMLQLALKKGAKPELNAENGQYSVSFTLDEEDIMLSHEMFSGAISRWTRKGVSGWWEVDPHSFSKNVVVNFYHPEPGDKITVEPSGTIYIEMVEDRMVLKDMPKVNRIHINSAYQDLPTSLIQVGGTISMFLLIFFSIHSIL